MSTVNFTCVSYSITWYYEIIKASFPPSGMAFHKANLSKLANSATLEISVQMSNPDLIPFLTSVIR